MVDLGIYKEKFAESGLRVFERAVDEAQRRNQNYVSLGHIVQALLIEDAKIFDGVNDNLHVAHTSPSERGPLVMTTIEKFIEESPRYEGRGVRLAPSVIWFFKNARRKAHEQNRTQIEAADLVALLAYKPYVLSNQTLHP